MSKIPPSPPAPHDVHVFLNLYFFLQQMKDFSYSEERSNTKKGQDWGFYHLRYLNSPLTCFRTRNPLTMQEDGREREGEPNGQTL